MRYGDYEDDFEGGSGVDRNLAQGRDQDRDEDGDGHGSERDDVREGALMTMTRRDSSRDVRDLYNSSLDDMRSFLRERESAEDPMKSVTSNAVTGLELVAGAAFAGYLEQRFRQAGTMVPVGVTLAALGIAAAQFNMAGKFSQDLRNVSFGALASAVALWAAGRGAINAEGAGFPGATAAGSAPTTAGMASMPSYAPSFPMPQTSSFLQMPPQQAPQAQPSMPMFMAAQAQPQGAVASRPAVGMMDFQNLVNQRTR